MTGPGGPPKPTQPVDQFSASFGQMNLGGNSNDLLSMPGSGGGNLLPPSLQSSGPPPQSSRLAREWKIPQSEGEDMLSNDFVRAPGAGKQTNNFATTSPTSSSTWGSQAPTSRSGIDSSGVWANTSENSQADKSIGSSLLDSSWAQPPSSAANNSNAYSDLEIRPFEPGKLWMMKSVEDDPSITPGSVTPSPLLNSMTKASTVASDLPLPSSTWAYNPHGDIKNPAPPSKAVWSQNTEPSSSSDLWPMKNAGSSGGSKPGNSGWGGLGRGGGWPPSSAAPPSGWPTASSASSTQQPTTWLMLRNLTPQIDGSTLKTLCMQHGPLVNFHLALNQGFALVNYGSREEAGKAQGNLNNCILSNTTILAEFASDSDVKGVIGSGGNTSSGASSGWPGQRQATPTSSGSKVEPWSTATTASLWGPSANGASSAASLWSNDTSTDQHRATPSSLKNFLPNDLLTSEPTM